MPDYTLREYTQAEYEADMQKLLSEKGLRNAVEDICDRINSLSSVLGYVQHREIQEYLSDILYLIEMDKEQKGENE